VRLAEISTKEAAIRLYWRLVLYKVADPLAYAATQDQYVSLGSF
jgi:hypothetical protein